MFFFLFSNIFFKIKFLEKFCQDNYPCVKLIGFKLFAKVNQQMTLVETEFSNKKKIIFLPINRNIWGQYMTYCSLSHTDLSLNNTTHYNMVMLCLPIVFTIEKSK